MKTNIIWITVLMFFSAMTLAHGAGIEAGIGGWHQTPSGNISYKGVNADDDIDIKDDLKYDSESRVMGRVKIDMPLLVPNIYVVAAPMSFEGKGRKDVNFNFGDFEFSGGVDFNSKVTLNQYDLAFFYGIPGIKTASLGKLNVDVGLNARLVDFSAEITGRETVTGLPVTAERSLAFAVPMVYASLQIMPTERFAIDAEARGISINGNSIYSFIGRLRVKVGGPAFIAGGYRFDTLDIDEEDVKIEARFGGPFLEVGLKF